ncbi:hypothetical protein GPJ56_002630 [Histomonas meleagridis]|uniref:uncharacterized protein n=1 Tax=Histomonas meleagridis TaxID=135588 RepID=UPI00355A7290|nr:hypothetical protein GPJ56_002630 [Histomonas meleagridis]KAH0801429.1 hypothetical protein GO595_006024 [Histomonas meleagridis]
MSNFLISYVPKSKKDIEKSLEKVSSSILTFDYNANSNKGWSSIIQSDLSIEDIKNEFPDCQVTVLQSNQITFPYKDYKIKEYINITPSFLRVKQCTPEIHGSSVLYTTDDFESVSLVHSRFLSRKQWTHFLAVPVGVLFPDFDQKVKQQFQHLSDKTHLTLCMLYAENDSEVLQFCEAFEEVIYKVSWPEDLSLTLPNLDTFGEPNKASILYANPAGKIVDSLFEFVSLFSEACRDRGLTYIEPANTMHMTVMRARRSFDATEYIKNYVQPPPIDPHEIRLVQRFKNDDDGFYHTVKKIDFLETSNKNEEN